MYHNQLKLSKKKQSKMVQSGQGTHTDNINVNGGISDY